MSDFKLRPRYKFINSKPPTELSSSLIKTANSDRQLWPFELKKTHSHLIFSYSKAHKKIWSPEMDVNITEEGTLTFIRVIIGPAAAVWTFFMFLYTAAIVGFFGGGLLAYSQFLLKKEIWAIWLIPISIILALAVYLATKLGKKKALDQMLYFKKFFDEALPNSKLVDKDV